MILIDGITLEAIREALEDLEVELNKDSRALQTIYEFYELMCTKDKIYFSAGPNLKYPWHELKVGDSFVTTQRMYSAVDFMNSRHAPKKFKARKKGKEFTVMRIN